jgi:DNA-binding CsgD family transcriptional regulator
MAPALQRAMYAAMGANPDSVRRVHAAPGVLVTATQNMGLTKDEALALPVYADHLHPFGVYDALGINVVDASGCAFSFSAPMPDLRRPSRREAGPWRRIAVHIAAGARLRATLKGATHREPTRGVDAVLSPAGVVQHAEPEAQGAEGRQALRDAARSIDRARTRRVRRDDGEALDLWQGLVAGRWSLVEQFDSDGRRFMVARRNDPQVTDPRALNLRERQVLAYVAIGHPAKLIGYSLGVSPSSISTTRRTAMRKLGLKTTADVVRLFAQAPRTVISQEAKA